MPRLTGIMTYNKELEQMVPMTAKQAKQEIMSYMGFKDKREYEKAYDIIRNKLRNYEAVNKVPAEKKQSVTDFFYRYARAKSNPAYQMSSQMQEIMATSSASTGKAQKRLVEREQVKDPVILTPAQKVVMDNLMKDYAKLIETDPLVQSMIVDIKNPYNLKRALREYTDLLKMSKEGEKKASGGFTTMSFGYDSIANFDYSAYLDNNAEDDFWL